MCVVEMTERLRRMGSALDRKGKGAARRDAGSIAVDDDRFFDAVNSFAVFSAEFSLEIAEISKRKKTLLI